jgi:hypothetical protein
MVSLQIEHLWFFREGKWHGKEAFPYKRQPAVNPSILRPKISPSIQGKDNSK